MTVTTTSVEHGYFPGAAMAPEAIPFQFLDPGDLIVTHVAAATGVRTVLSGASFAIAGDGAAATGTIRALAAWPAGDAFVVRRRTARVQLAKIVAHEPVPAAAVEQQLDRMALVGQETDAAQAALALRAVTLPEGEAAVTLPAAAARAGRTLIGLPGGGFGTAAIGDGQDPGLRGDLADPAKGVALVATRSAAAGAIATSQAEVNARDVHVMDYVTLVDRVLLAAGIAVDLAYAYNAATGATAVWNAGLIRTIRAPRQKHKLLSTVWVRAGQRIQGVGWGNEIDCIGCAGPVFAMGRRSDGSVDPFGPPCELADIRTLGSSAADAVVDCRVAGFGLYNLFLGSPFIGINLLNCSDGVGGNIIVEQCQIGMQISGCRNTKFGNLNLSTAHEAIRFGSNNFDLCFNGGGIYYPKVHGVIFVDGGVRNRGIDFHGFRYIMNRQGLVPGVGDWSGFMAMVRIRGSDVQLGLYGCTWRNWRGHAILHDAGAGATVTVSHPVFDAQATDLVNYTDPTTTARAFKSITGNGDYLFVAAEVYNLPAQPFELGGAAPSTLVLQLPRFANNTGGAAEVLATNTNASSKVRVIGATRDRALVVNTGAAKIEVMIDVPDAGWTAATGAANRGAFAAAAAGAAPVAYEQAAFQAALARIAALEGRLVAGERALRSHGLIDG